MPANAFKKLTSTRQTDDDEREIESCFSAVIRPSMHPTHVVLRKTFPGRAFHNFRATESVEFYEVSKRRSAHLEALKL